MTEIQRKSRVRYDGFVDLSACWTQDKEHRRHFISHLNCPEKQQYHHNARACKPFDDLVERWAGEYKASCFSFYKIVGNKPMVSTYTEDVVTSKKLIRDLATRFHLVLRPLNEVNVAEDSYSEWPDHFTLQAVFPVTFDGDREEILKAIESCIKRRILFRNACVRSCCKRIDTTSHDSFLLVLQILRARILY